MSQTLVLAVAVFLVAGGDTGLAGNGKGIALCFAGCAKSEKACQD